MKRLEIRQDKNIFSPYRISFLYRQNFKPFLKIWNHILMYGYIIIFQTFYTNYLLSLVSRNKKYTRNAYYNTPSKKNRSIFQLKITSKTQKSSKIFMGKKNFPEQYFSFLNTLKKYVYHHNKQKTNKVLKKQVNNLQI